MHARHIDTCLSCYVLDHCNGDHELLLGAYVTAESTMDDVKAELLSEIGASDYDKPGFDYDAARAAIAEAFEGMNGDALFDSRLEPVDPDDDTAESCYAWFRLSWEAPE